MTVLPVGPYLGLRKAQASNGEVSRNDPCKRYRNGHKPHLHLEVRDRVTKQTNKLQQLVHRIYSQMDRLRSKDIGCPRPHGRPTLSRRYLGYPGPHPGRLGVVLSQRVERRSLSARRRSPWTGSSQPPGSTSACWARTQSWPGAFGLAKWPRDITKLQEAWNWDRRGKDMQVLWGIGGMIVLLAIAFLLSTNRRR
jgi:hypothetical protein